MVFFLWSLALSFVLTVILVILLMDALRNNRERKNRHGVSFLMPVALTALFLTLTIGVTIPRVLDSVNFMTQTYSIEEIQIPENGLGWNCLTTDKHRYFYNQWQTHLVSGVNYRIEYTPRSRFIVRATRVETQIGPTHAYGVSEIETESTKQPS